MIVYDYFCTDTTASGCAPATALVAVQQPSETSIVPVATTMGRPDKRAKRTNSGSMEESALVGLEGTPAQELMTMVASLTCNLHTARSARNSMRKRLRSAEQAQRNLQGRLDAATSSQLQIVVPGKRGPELTRRFRITIPGIYDLGWRQSKGSGT